MRYIVIPSEQAGEPVYVVVDTLIDFAVGAFPEEGQAFQFVAMRQANDVIHSAE